MKNSHSESYAAAGVDVTAGYEAVERIKPMVESTYIPGVMGTLGGFGGMFAPDLTGMKKPVLVSGTDGVGTKLKIAFLMDKHDTVGIDCVAMCVNDIVCGGAAPMFFLDYIACGKNHPARIADIVSGITEGCRQAECALVGGETAEMPGFYPEEEYDLAGFSVGLVDEEKIIDGKKLSQGDVLIGLASSGVHSNGFSLVRKIFDVEHADLKTPRDDLNGKSLGEALLAPTRIYVKAVKALLKGGVDIHAVSHITGGGFYENVPLLPPPAHLRPDPEGREHSGAGHVQHLQYGHWHGAGPARRPGPAGPGDPVRRRRDRLSDRRGDLRRGRRRPGVILGRGGYYPPAFPRLSFSAGG